MLSATGSIRSSKVRVACQRCKSKDNANVVPYLGRLLWVDLITLEGGLKCSSVSPSIRLSTKSFSDFNEIWYVHCVSKKVPTFYLSLTLSNLNRFSTFCTAGKHVEICYKNHDITHLTLGMLLHYFGKLKIHIFCRCGRKCKQIAFLIASNSVIHPQNFNIFGIWNSESFSILIVDNIFGVTVVNNFVSLNFKFLVWYQAV